MGNPGKRPLPPNEPKPTVGIGPPGDWLDAKAKAYYQWLSPKLVAIGLLTEVDQSLFERHCQLKADVERLTVEVRKEGEVVVNQGRGEAEYERRSGKAQLLAEKHSACLATEAALGLTPAARSRLGVAKVEAKPGDKLRGFISKKAE